jgi:ATP-binding cassette subfamily B protein
MPRSFPFYRQLDAMDCGATCLRMVARHYKRFYSLEYMRNVTYLDREGVSLRSISDAAEQIGFHTLAVKISFDRLQDDIPLPCIAHWRQEHFVVVYKVNAKHVWIADPASGKVRISREEFMQGWISDEQDGDPVGVLLLLEPTPEFYEKEGEQQSQGGFSYVFTYLRRYKSLVYQLLLGVVVGSLLQIIFPFLVQAMVDYGISRQDVNFIWLVIMAQIMLYFSQTAVELIRSWILVHMGTRINISLISDYLLKLMRLPIHFFDTKLTGDILTRITDNQRVEQFLTSTSLMTLFSAFNFVVFAVVLAIYDMYIFGLHVVATALYIIWILLFMKKRRDLDFKRFDQEASNQTKILQMIDGIQDIKMHQAEKQLRWDWENTQARLFRLKLKYLHIDQWQRSGGAFINELKNIFITFIAANAVVNNDMTIGMMLAILYIIGQLNSPIQQFLRFLQSAQDARISLERMNEIHQDGSREREEDKISIIPDKGDLWLEKVHFQYGGPQSPMVLKNINLFIPEGKVTAIVGSSGSGKTTLLKLLLKYYRPVEGQIRLGDLNLQNVNNSIWRRKCGVVMQDSFIFSDTITRNIALGAEIIDEKRLLNAARIANIQPFVDSLPLGFNTRIGKDGIGLSQGQKQRILIARAIYKEPEYLFFDEATNALDSYNEMLIMDQMESFFKGKTVIQVAHRLSTVKSADNIIVLEEGEVVEQGTHRELTAKRGAYYFLVKNQLELGV